MFTRKPDSRDAAPPVNTPRTSVLPPPVSSPPQPSTANQSPPTQAATDQTRTQSIIGNDLSIEGQSITIRCKGALCINGNIQADLHSKQLIVGHEAVITGAIAANDVEVHGRVQGAIYGTHVLLHQSAHVDGDIHSEHLQIERGATFDGRSRKVHNAQEIAPKLEADGETGGEDKYGATVATPFQPIPANGRPRLQS